MLTIKKWWQCCYCELHNSSHKTSCQACFRSRMGMFKSIQYNKHHQSLLLSGYIRLYEFKKLLGSDIHIMILSFYNEIIEWIINSSQWTPIKTTYNDESKKDKLFIYGPKTDYFYGLSFDLILKKDNMGNAAFAVQLNANSNIKSMTFCVSLETFFGVKELIFFIFIDILSIECHNDANDINDTFDAIDINVTFSWGISEYFYPQRNERIKLINHQTDQLYIDYKLDKF